MLNSELIMFWSVLTTAFLLHWNWNILHLPSPFCHASSLSAKSWQISMDVDRHRVCGQDASKWMVDVQTGTSRLLRGCDGGEVIGLLLWGVDRCCFKERKYGLLFSFSPEDVWKNRLLCLFIITPKSLASHQLLPSSVSLNPCKGLWGREVNVGGSGIAVTRVTPRLVLFYPVTAFLCVRRREMGWGGAALLSNRGWWWMRGRSWRCRKESSCEAVLAQLVNSASVGLWRDW